MVRAEFTTPLDTEAHCDTKYLFDNLWQLIDRAKPFLLTALTSKEKGQQDKNQKLNITVGIRTWGSRTLIIR